MSASDRPARGRLGVIAGSSLRGGGVEGPGFEYVQRHAPPAAPDRVPGPGEAGSRGSTGPARRYVLPHLIDHATNLRRLRDAGCDRILAIASVGSLKPELEPGTLVCPDDFIALDVAAPTTLDGPDAHRVPGFDGEWRREVCAAVAAAGTSIVDRGVYWQVTGPRLETRAEVRLIAEHADVVGMTIGSECVVAGELGLAYAAICVVDNFANGVAGERLTNERVLAAQAEHRAGVEHLLEVVAPALA